MAKLKLGAITNDKSVKLTVELPHLCIVICLLTPKCWPRTGQGIAEPTKLIAPMLARFMQRIAHL